MAEDQTRTTIEGQSLDLTGGTERASYVEQAYATHLLSKIADIWPALRPDVREAVLQEFNATHLEYGTSALLTERDAHNIISAYDRIAVAPEAPTTQRQNLERQAIEWGLDSDRVSLMHENDINNAIRQQQITSPIDIVTELHNDLVIATSDTDIDITNIDRDDNEGMRQALLQIEFRSWRSQLNSELNRLRLGEGDFPELAGYIDASQSEIKDIWIAQKMLDAHAKMKKLEASHLKESQAAGAMPEALRRYNEAQMARTCIEIYISKGFFPVIEKSLDLFINQVYSQTKSGMDINILFQRFFGKDIVETGTDVYHNLLITNYTGGIISNVQNRISISELPLPSHESIQRLKNYSTADPVRGYTISNAVMINSAQLKSIQELDGMARLIRQDNLGMTEAKDALIRRSLLDALAFAEKGDTQPSDRFSPKESNLVRLAELVDSLLSYETPNSRSIYMVHLAQVVESLKRITRAADYIRGDVPSLEGLAAGPFATFFDFRDLILSLQLYDHKLTSQGVARTKTERDKQRLASSQIIEGSRLSESRAISIHREAINSLSTSGHASDARNGREERRRARYEVINNQVVVDFRAANCEEPYFTNLIDRDRISSQDPKAVKAEGKSILPGALNALENAMFPLGRPKMIVKVLTPDENSRINPPELIAAPIDQAQVIDNIDPIWQRAVNRITTLATNTSLRLRTTRTQIPDAVQGGYDWVFTPQISPANPGLVEKLRTKFANELHRRGMAGKSYLRDLGVYPISYSATDGQEPKTFWLNNSEAIVFNASLQRDPFTRDINGLITDLDMQILNDELKQGGLYIKWENINIVEMVTEPVTDNANQVSENTPARGFYHLIIDNEAFPKGIIPKIVKGYDDKWGLWKKSLGAMGSFLSETFNAAAIAKQVRDAIEGVAFNAINQVGYFYEMLGVAVNEIFAGSNPNSFLYNRDSTKMWEVIDSGVTLEKHFNAFVGSIKRYRIYRSFTSDAFAPASAQFWTDNSHLIGYNDTSIENTTRDPITRDTYGRITGLDLTALEAGYNNGDLRINLAKIDNPKDGPAIINITRSGRAERRAELTLDNFYKSASGDKDKSPDSLFDILKPENLGDEARTAAARRTMQVLLNSVGSIEAFNALMGWSVEAMQRFTGNNELSMREYENLQVQNYLEAARFAGFLGYLQNTDGSPVISTVSENGIVSRLPVLLTEDQTTIWTNDDAIRKSLGVGDNREVPIPPNRIGRMAEMKSNSSAAQNMLRVIETNIWETTREEDGSIKAESYLSGIADLYALIEFAHVQRTNMLVAANLRSSFEKATHYANSMRSARLAFQLGTQQTEAQTLTQADPVLFVHFSKNPVGNGKTLGYQMPGNPVMKAAGPRKIRDALACASLILEGSQVSTGFINQLRLPRYFQPNATIVADVLQQINPFTSGIITNIPTVLPDGRNFDDINYDLFQSLNMPILIGVLPEFRSITGWISESIGDRIKVNILRKNVDDVRNNRLSKRIEARNRMNTSIDALTIIQEVNDALTTWGLPKSPGEDVEIVKTVGDITEKINIGDSTTKGFFKKITSNAFDGAAASFVTGVSVITPVVALQWAGVPISIFALGFWAFVNSRRPFGEAHSDLRYNIWEKAGISITGLSPSWQTKTGVKVGIYTLPGLEEQFQKVQNSYV